MWQAGGEGGWWRKDGERERERRGVWGGGDKGVEMEGGWTECQWSKRMQGGRRRMVKRRKEIEEESKERGKGEEG